MLSRQDPEATWQGGRVLCPQAVLLASEGMWWPCRVRAKCTLAFRGVTTTSETMRQQGSG